MCGSGSCLCLKFPELKTTCQFLSTLHRWLDNRSQGVGVEGTAGLLHVQSRYFSAMNRQSGASEKVSSFHSREERNVLGVTFLAGKTILPQG